MKKVLTLIFLISISTIFSQEMEKEKDSIDNEVVNYKIIEKAPVYKGCEEFDSNSYARHCYNRNIQNLIRKNFNSDVTNDPSIPNGRYRVKASFIVNKIGEVVDIKISGTEHELLINESKRIINLIPKFSSPGIQRGKPVRVSYSLPISFHVNKDPIKEEK